LKNGKVNQRDHKVEDTMDAGLFSISLAENEEIIRSYRCTKLRKLFVIPTIGYLSITNKRIIYHSEGKSVTGESTIVSELPLEDVSGISSSIGISFNILFFFLICLVAYFLTMLIVTVFPYILTGIFTSILYMIPYLIYLLFEKNILNYEIKERAIKTLEKTEFASIINIKNNSLILKIIRSIFLIGLLLFAWNVSNQGGYGNFPTFLGFVVLILSYLLIYTLIFGKSMSFSLKVNSKSAKGFGINIPGNVFSLLFGSDNTALQSLYAGPDIDASIVIKEIGAMIIDIQQLGNNGASKWKK
jgi:hypothetical protein